MARVLLSERRRLPDVSDRLRRFTEEMPYERGSILAFVADVAAGSTTAPAWQTWAPAMRRTASSSNTPST